MDISFFACLNSIHDYQHLKSSIDYTIRTRRSGFKQVRQDTNLLWNDQHAQLENSFRNSTWGVLLCSLLCSENEGFKEDPLFMNSEPPEKFHWSFLNPFLRFTSHAEFLWNSSKRSILFIFLHKEDVPHEECTPWGITGEFLRTSSLSPFPMQSGKTFSHH